MVGLSDTASDEKSFSKGLNVESGDVTCKHVMFVGITGHLGVCII